MSTPQEPPPKPKPKRKPAKAKGKAKEIALPAAPAEPTTVTMPMDIDPPTTSTTTTSTSTDSTPSRPRPKPKPAKKAATERNTPPNTSGAEATLNAATPQAPSESAWTVLMLDGNTPTVTDTQKASQLVEQPEQEQDELMEDEEPTSSAPARKRGRPRTSTTDPPTRPTTKPKPTPRAAVVTGSRQSRRLADKKGGASDT
ncbi:hypothetical protein PM082_005206 [Marasmius tenuissimus]|nr:hypothetical protein PM082_005206 [Marasmius tenuissimus]